MVSVGGGLLFTNVF